MIRFFSRKFKLRIVHHNGDLFRVEYADYVFIPMYQPIVYFSNFGIASDYTNYPPRLFKSKEAEEFVKGIKSMKDVTNLICDEFDKEIEFDFKRSELLKETRPYDSKQII